MSLSKLRGKYAQAALRGCGAGDRWGHGDEFSHVLDTRGQNVMQLSQDDVCERVGAHD